MAPGIEGLSTQVPKSEKSLISHHIQFVQFSPTTCVGVSFQGHCVNVFINDISMGEQNHEAKSGSELRPLECGLHF